MDIEGYAGKDVPLAAYGALMLTYVVVFGNLFYYASVGEDGPLRLDGVDFWLIAVASYKLSRLVTMSFVGSFLRAPFTKRGESKKGGEVQDEARGEGLQRAIGSLLTCPFCFNLWAATALSFGYALFPRLTMMVAQVLVIAAIGDLLHFGYRNMREQSE